jgi:thioredoxin 1
VDVQKKQMMLAAVLSAAVIFVPLALKRRAASASIRAENAGAPAAPVADARPLPKLVDLGTTTCAPCKAMLGVVAELESGYGHQLAVEFINVQQQEDATRRYGVKVIPTQVFLDPEGKELFRHTGFFATEAIVAKWRDLGYPMDRRPVGG